MAESTPVRIGFVGVGGRAESHLRAISKVHDAKIVAIADIDGDRARAVAERYEAAAYETTEQMLDAEALDAAWVVTPPRFHAGPVTEIAKRGINVYVEKPVALNMADALSMERAVDDAGVIAAASYQIRHLDTVARVHDALASKDITMLNTRYYWSPPGRWARDTAMSGGQIVEQATHLVDLMRYWAGEVKTVHAMYGNRALASVEDFNTWDANVVNLGFESGAVGSVASTYALFQGVPDNVRIDIVVRELLIRFSYASLQIQSPWKSDEFEPTNNPDEAASAAFLHAVRTGDRSGVLAPLDDANRTLAVTLAANESARTGKVIDVASFVEAESAGAGMGG